MNASDLLALAPLLLVAAGALVVLLAMAIRAGSAAAFALTVLTLIAALVSLGVSRAQAPHAFTAQISVDGFALFAIGLILAATLAVALMSWPRMKEPEDEHGEYHFLLLLASLGACVLAAASAFAAFFLGLELLSVSLFGMIGYRRAESPGTEASIKYLVLAGVSAAFVLFGMALAYEETGSMEFASVLAALGSGTRGLLVPGIGLMIVGIGFKLAVVPFHLWTPDVYDGAPAPVAGFIATISKGAVAVLLMRLLGPAIAAVNGPLPWVFGTIAALSMFVGNLLALRERNVKRILAYSSIANLGYLLVAFLAPGAEARLAVAFYLAAYFAAALGAFAAVTALSTREREAADLDSWRGIARTRPWLAAGFTVALLSLAGLPLTAGFVGKFVILQAGAGAGQWALAIMLVVNTTISIFYYLKVVSALYRTPDESAAGAAAGAARAHPLAGLSLALLSLVAVTLGVYPSPLLRLLEQLAAG